MTRESGQASDRDVVSARTFAASREDLFDAFSDPKRLAGWWGPKGFATTIEEFDLRPGGRWRLEMRGPDGARYAMEKTFVEVSRPERIVLRHTQDGHGFVMTMTFSEDARGARLAWRMRFDTREEHDAVAKVVAVANEENFDRLETHLAKRGRA